MLAVSAVMYVCCFQISLLRILNDATAICVYLIGKKNCFHCQANFLCLNLFILYGGYTVPNNNLPVKSILQLTV